MEAKKLLIATTNKGKLEEIRHFLGDLPFDLVGLEDLSLKIEEPEETGNTLEENAILKAKYYAEKTGLISLADDTGLFVAALDGWPGIKAARVGKDGLSRRENLLSELKNIKNREAFFEACISVYDPEKGTVFTSIGKIEGNILESERGDSGYDYDSVFEVKGEARTFAEMTVQEKNSFSHRSKALLKTKHYLQNVYSTKHIVVPCGIIIKNGKMLSALRNDPHRPDFHRKWELPGGRVELGENIAGNLVREIKEETGYDVEIVEMLNHIEVDWSEKLGYQIYLIPHVCKIVGGDGKYSDAEILDIEFVEPDKIFDRELLGNDPIMLKKVLPRVKELIAKYNL